MTQPNEFCIFVTEAVTLIPFCRFRFRPRASLLNHDLYCARSKKKAAFSGTVN